MEKHILSYEEFLYDKIATSSEEYLFYFWNQFCLEEQDGEGLIYYNDEDFLNKFDRKTIVKHCFDDEYNGEEKFVTITPVFGEWESSNNVRGLINDEGELVEFFVKNKAHIKEYTSYCQKFKGDPDFIIKEIKRLTDGTRELSKVTFDTLLRLLPTEKVK